MSGLKTNLKNTRPKPHHLKTETTKRKVEMETRPKPQKSMPRPRSVSRPSSLICIQFGHFRHNKLVQAKSVKKAFIFNQSDF